MKKLIIVVAILSTGFLSCKKDKAQPAVATENVTLENATVIAAGNLSFASDANGGQVKIYRQQNGKYILALEQISGKAGNTSFVINLSSSKTVSPSSIKICSVPNLNGEVLHELPGNIDLTVFKYLIIQAEPSEEVIATAELN